MPKIGDIVRYLNDIGGGKIVRIENNMAWVDDDGFETPVLLKECVVVRTAEEIGKTKEQLKSEETKKNNVTPTFKVDSVESGPIYNERKGGDILNFTLGFEPVERTRMSETDFDVSLINDSNYYVLFSLSTREKDALQWTCRYAGLVEPDTDLWLGTFARTLVTTFDYLCFEYIAFKKDKEYELKNSRPIILKIDTTKFFKLHCFRQNKYFDKDVLAFNLVENGAPAGHNEQNFEILNTSSLGKNDNLKFPNENKKVCRGNNRTIKHISEPIIVDLHIDSLSFS